MPVYEFRCPECLKKEEVLVDMDDRNKPRLHSCGTVMDRLVSIPHLAIIKVYGRDTIKDTLNEEHEYSTKDKRSVRSKRSQEALARGLDLVKPVIGRGFG